MAVLPLVNETLGKLDISNTNQYSRHFHYISNKAATIKGTLTEQKPGLIPFLIKYYNKDSSLLPHSNICLIKDKQSHYFRMIGDINNHSSHVAGDVYLLHHLSSVFISRLQNYCPSNRISRVIHIQHWTIYPKLVLKQIEWGIEFVKNLLQTSNKMVGAKVFYPPIFHHSETLVLNVPYEKYN